MGFKQKHVGALWVPEPKPAPPGAPIPPTPEPKRLPKGYYDASADIDRRAGGGEQLPPELVQRGTVQLGRRTGRPLLRPSWGRADVRARKGLR